MSFFFFKQKTAYEITRRDWSSDVCSSDLHAARAVGVQQDLAIARWQFDKLRADRSVVCPGIEAQRAPAITWQCGQRHFRAVVRGDVLRPLAGIAPASVIDARLGADVEDAVALAEDRRQIFPSHG